jgi:hypothetical protein
VRVALPARTAIDGFVPRLHVGYQVKKPDMTPATIGPEMRPDGALRPAIRALAENGGAYIIVSLGTHVSDTALDERRAEMRRALGRIQNRDALLVDFYDRARVASWCAITPAWSCGCGIESAAPCLGGGRMKHGLIRSLLDPNMGWLWLALIRRESGRHFGQRGRRRRLCWQPEPYQRKVNHRTLRLRVSDPSVRRDTKSDETPGKLGSALGGLLMLDVPSCAASQAIRRKGTSVGKSSTGKSAKRLAKSFARAIPDSRTSPSEPLY